MESGEHFHCMTGTPAIQFKPIKSWLNYRIVMIYEFQETRKATSAKLQLTSPAMGTISEVTCSKISN